MFEHEGFLTAVFEHEGFMTAMFEHEGFMPRGVGEMQGSPWEVGWYLELSSRAYR